MAVMDTYRKINVHMCVCGKCVWKGHQRPLRDPDTGRSPRRSPSAAAGRRIRARRASAGGRAIAVGRPGAGRWRVGELSFFQVCILLAARPYITLQMHAHTTTDVHMLNIILCYCRDSTATCTWLACVLRRHGAVYFKVRSILGPSSPHAVLFSPDRFEKVNHFFELIASKRLAVSIGRRRSPPRITWSRVGTQRRSD